MDNVTHALAGLVLAEAAVQLRARLGRRPAAERPPAAPSFGAAAWAAGAAAANLPDVDVFYTTLVGDRLTYLLHHRGHTHTVVGAVVGALALWAAVVAVWRWRARRRAGAGAPTGADARWLLGLVAVAVLSHLVLDWTNDYGVHPFWPVDDGWRYGDRVFIAEPWLWVAAVPPLAWAARRRATRAGLVLVLALGLALAWRVALVPRAAAALLTGAAAAGALAARRLAPGGRAAFALGGWAAVEGAFGAGAGAARAAAASAARASDPGARLVDVVVTPRPGAPPCASALVVEVAPAAGPGARGPVYRVTSAWTSAAPALVDADACAGRADAGGLRGGGVMARRSPRPRTAAVRWERTWEAPLGELQALARGNCVAAAALRFLRVPYWLPLGNDTLAVGDLRYTGGPGAGFADLLVPARPAACPAGVPPWRPPRADLLGGGA